METIDELIEKAQPYWEQYIRHPFVMQLVDGTLPIECFRHYLKQDYIYLFHYSRALSLGIFKANHFDDIRRALQATQAIVDEVALHVAFCSSWGISQADLLATQESPACVAYTRYLIDTGMKGGLAHLYAALAPCAVGYAQIGQWASVHACANNPYQVWVDTYACEAFQATAREMAMTLHGLYGDLNEGERIRVQGIFTTATRMETAFWQCGLDLN